MLEAQLSQNSSDGLVAGTMERCIHDFQFIRYLFDDFGMNDLFL